MSGRQLYYGLVLNFDTTIAAGGNLQRSAKIEAQAPFTIQAIQCTVWHPAAVGTVIAGTPWAHDVTAGNAANVNTLPSLAHATLQITVNNNNLFRNPVRLSNLAGRGWLPHILLTQHTVQAGNEVLATLTNNSAAFDMQGQLLLEGFQTLSA